MPKRCSSGPTSPRPSSRRPRATSPGGEGRLVPVGGDPARHPRDAGARARGSGPALRARRGRAGAVAAALALGDFDLVLADEWQRQPHSRPAGVDRADLHRDPVHLVLPADHPAARRHRDAVPLAELAGEVWTTGHRESGWEAMTNRTCRELGGLRPRHPPPDERQRHLPRGRRRTASPSRCSPSSSSPRPDRASPCGRSPRARSTGRSSPRRAPPMPSGRPSRPCWPRSAARRRTSAGRLRHGPHGLAPQSLPYVREGVVIALPCGSALEP